MSLLVRRILCQMPRRFSTTGALHAQDFSFPQGLQGEIANGAGKDAICQLWLEKCKLYGYNNCEERLEQLLKTAPNPK
ncbi:unnamed protein product [Adineta ricciae]|uniref:Uncharacterized protein n=1 Tax=Adineta ricciae TaxID=249248 RepID=A0A814CWD8_ADIRI|nr:unnamed protein product [Adineta ricciae]